MLWSQSASWRVRANLVALCAALLAVALLPGTSRAEPRTALASYPSVTGAQALARAQSWVDAHVPYSQSEYWQHQYRQDCVGLVSMAWDAAPAPGMGTTLNVPNYVTPISKDDLQPGDALLNKDGGGTWDYAHIVLFAGWADAQHTHYKAYEETPPQAHFVSNMPYPYWPGYATELYQPVRYKGMQLATPTNPNQPAFYAGKIVQWDGDTKAQKTAWLVAPDLKRYWIPDSSTYNCLVGTGFAFAGPISSTLLDQLPDQTGQSASCGSNSLGFNQFLFRGSYLRSNSGQYSLDLQRSDGNLVLYGPSGALWANSKTSDFLILQASDSNLVTYSYSTGATWASNTSGSGANTLVVQDDGNLVLYAPGGIPIWDRFSGKLGTGGGGSNSPAFYAGKIVQWDGDTKAQKTAWLVAPDLKRYWIPDSSTYNCLVGKGFTFAGPISSTLLNQLPDQTGQSAACGGSSLGFNQFLFRGSDLQSSNGQYHLELQRSDGNLVLYGPSGALWANSKTSDFLILQASDSNLVTYSYSTGATWASNTSGSGANTLVVQDDGNLVLYAPGGIPIWDRFSGRLR